MESCEFRQDDEHEWHCTIHGVTMIGPEPVHCSVAASEAEERAIKQAAPLPGGGTQADFDAGERNE